jgi:class 3 adenylate cyclase/tetratricopeptide (TPR) repeat protein
MTCGAALERRCDSCGEPAPEAARFCMACGTALGVASPISSAQASSADLTDAIARSAPSLDERRIVTILFADLSGYTAIAERMDPESVKRQLDRILGRLGEEVLKYGGHVDKFIGDNVMATFGAPIAHGDDAVRAVRAGLGMQDAMSEINEPLSAQFGVAFELCVGVNTGEVLAGHVGEGYTVIGDAVNVAARLQAAAQPGTVTVGEETYRATRESVRYVSVAEPLRLKGKREPVPAWEALDGRESIHTELSPASSAQAAFVGRAGELAQMHALLGRVTSAGTAHMVTMIGEPGVGKSRLLRQFESELSGELVRHGRCLPYGSSIVYWPLGEVIRAECEIVETDPPALAWTKLSQRIGVLLATPDGDPRSASARAGVIGRLLGIETPDGGGVSELEDPVQARELFFAAVRSCVEGMARERPLVLIWEDIHWADDGMLDLIEYLLQWVRAPVLQICLAREQLLERREGWGHIRRNATTAFLEPLGAAESVELVTALLQGETSGAGVAAAVAARAGGNPLFAEEMVRRLAEQENAKVEELPATVQALLAARLDSLEPFQRRLLAHASVVGRSFDEDALVPVAEAEGGDLAEALRTLREKDIIVAGDGDSLTRRVELAFKHALIRDAAYEMLPKAVRAQKHFEVAGFIELRAGERVEEVVALLAEHYSTAAALGEELGIPDSELSLYRSKARHYLEAAGDAATAVHSNSDAFSCYSEAAELAGGDPDSTARLLEKGGDVALRLGRVDAAIAAWEQALDFHSSRGELEHVAELHRKIGAGLAHRGERKRAIEHHQLGINLIKDGEPSLVLVRLYEEAAWLYMQTGDNMLAIYASEKALRLAERLGEVRAASRAHGIFGRVFGRIGDTAKARENLEKAVELARDSDAHETVLALMALGHHFDSSDGDYASAGAAYGEALELAQRVGDVPAEIELHAALAQLALYAADWDEVIRSSDASALLAEREGLIGKLCMTYTARGTLHWRGGQWIDSEAAYRRAYELAEQIGWSEVSVDALCGLSNTLRDQDALDGADAALAQALEVCDRAGLIAQSIQASSARALVHRMAGREEQAREAAAAALEQAARVPYPVGRAAAAEATGIAGSLPQCAIDLENAREAWDLLQRPLDAARCELLRGERLLEHDHREALASLTRATAAYEALGVTHLARRARELARPRGAGDRNGAPDPGS